jgi:hypothetical protein
LWWSNREVDSQDAGDGCGEKLKSQIYHPYTVAVDFGWMIPPRATMLFKAGNNQDATQLLGCGGEATLNCRRPTANLWQSWMRLF